MLTDLSPRDAELAEWFHRHGFLRPYLTVRALRAGHIKPQTAAAVLSKETGNGANIWGHDADRAGCIPPCGGPVTRANYRAYRARRRRDRRMQGCGPVQLTWFEFQDRADRLGGCWRPGVSMRVGFDVVRELVEAHGLERGLNAYNGDPSGAYGRDVVARREHFERALHAAGFRV